MKKAIFFLTVLCSICTFAAQPMLPRKVKSRLPELIYRLRTDFVSMEQLQREFCNGSKWGQDNHVKTEVWQAFSDSDKNVTYTTSKKEGTYFELGFGEQVFIAEIKDDMALVYQSDRQRHGAVDKELEIPLDAKCCGWVPMENLLLWHSCPSGPCGIQKKCIILPSINNTLKAGITIKYSPNESEQKSWMDDGIFYYILKESPDGESVLFCKDPSVFPNAVNLCGWIKKTDIFAIESPLFLEPNWDPEFVDHFQGETVNLYDSPSKENVIYKWKIGLTDESADFFTRYRMRPYQLRFPVPGTPNDNGIVECRMFFDLGTPHQLSATHNINDYQNPLSEYLLHVLGEENFRRLSLVRGNKIINAYAEWKVNDEDSFWRPVLFLNSSEVHRLLETLRPVYKVAQRKSDDRSLYHDAMMSVFMAVTADSPQLSDKELEALHPADFYHYYYNIYSQHYNKTHTIGEICNSTHVRGAEYYEFLHDFKRKYERLESIFTRDYYYQMKNGNGTFYWIPMEYLP